MKNILNTSLSDFFKNNERNFIKYLLILKNDLQIPKLCDQITEIMLEKIRRLHPCMQDYLKDLTIINHNDPRDSVVPIKLIWSVISKVRAVTSDLEMISITPNNSALPLAFDIIGNVTYLMPKLLNYIDAAYETLQIVNQNARLFEFILGEQLLIPLQYKLNLALAEIKNYSELSDVSLVLWEKYSKILPKTMPQKHQSLENLTWLICNLPKIFKESAQIFQDATTENNLKFEEVKINQQALVDNLQSFVKGSQLTAIPAYMTFARLMSELLIDLIPAAGPLTEKSYNNAVIALDKLKKSALPEFIIFMEELEQKLGCNPDELRGVILPVINNYYMAVVSWVQWLGEVSSYVDKTAETMNSTLGIAVQAIFFNNTDLVKTNQIKIAVMDPNLKVLVDSDFIMTIRKARIERLVSYQIQNESMQLKLIAAENFFNTVDGLLPSKLQNNLVALTPEKSKVGLILITVLLWNLIQNNIIFSASFILVLLQWSLVNKRRNLSNDTMVTTWVDYKHIQDIFVLCYPEQDYLICNNLTQWIQDRHVYGDLQTIKQNIRMCIHQIQAQAELQQKLLQFNCKQWDKSLVPLVVTTNQDKSIVIKDESALKKYRIDITTKMREEAVVHYQRLCDQLIPKVIGNQWSYLCGLDQLEKLNLSKEVDDFIQVTYKNQLRERLLPDVFTQLKFDTNDLPVSVVEEGYFILHKNYHNNIQFHQKIIVAFDHIRNGLICLESMSGKYKNSQSMITNTQTILGRASWVLDVVNALGYHFSAALFYLENAISTPHIKTLVVQCISILEPLKENVFFRPQISVLFEFTQNHLVSHPQNIKKIWSEQQDLVLCHKNGILKRSIQSQPRQQKPKTNKIERDKESDQNKPVDSLLMMTRILYYIPLKLNALLPKEDNRLAPYSSEKAEEKALELAKKMKEWGFNLDSANKILGSVCEFNSLLADTSHQVQALIEQIKQFFNKLSFQLLTLSDDAEFLLGEHPGISSEKFCQQISLYFDQILDFLPFQNVQDRLKVKIDITVTQKRLAREKGRLSREKDSITKFCNQLEQVINQQDQALCQLLVNVSDIDDDEYKNNFFTIFEAVQPFLAECKMLESTESITRRLQTREDFQNEVQLLKNDISKLKLLLIYKRNQLEELEPRCKQRVKYFQAMYDTKLAENKKIIEQFKTDHFNSKCVEYEAKLKDKLKDHVPELEKIIQQFDSTIKKRNEQVLELILNPLLDPGQHDLPKMIETSVDILYTQEYKTLIEIFHKLQDWEVIIQSLSNKCVDIEDSKMVLLKWMQSILLDSDVLPIKRIENITKRFEDPGVSAMLSRDTEGMIFGMVHEFKKMTLSIERPELILKNKIQNYLKNLSNLSIFRASESCENYITNLLQESNNK